MTTIRFPQNVIAVIWDFEKTLIPADMHDPLLETFGVDRKQFWEEVNALPAFYGRRDAQLLSPDTLYLSHILTYVEAGKFAGLDNKLLRRLGGELTFYRGMPSFMGEMKRAVEEDARFAKYGITLEHYVVSTGLRQIILGSAVADYVEGVWACEFLEATAPPGFLDRPDTRPAADATVRQVGYAIDNATKTRALFEINKGVNKNPAISVNTKIPHEHRRVPFTHMIYIADGPNDVPVFSVLNEHGGRTLAVHHPDRDRAYRQAADLLAEGRVREIATADYRQGQQAARCLVYWAEQIALKIAAHHATILGEHIGESANDVFDDPRSKRVSDWLD